jgi:cytochrome P450
MMILTNFGAGMEPIGITVSTLVCNILDSPGCQKKIQAEIDAALKSGKMGKIPNLRDMEEHLPYLNVCLRENMRLHPVIGMPLPRVAPAGGVELEGHFLPAGVSDKSSYKSYWLFF